MSAIKGDFLGFTFNGYHSSELGLVRVSDSNRYTENLLPTIQDKTVQVPGGDGTYYFGSFYTQRPINISVAFDDLSEEQFQKMRAIFGDKKIYDLIFDEMPYKVYKVKATGTPNLKYVCFNKDYDDIDRIQNETPHISTKQELYGVGAASPYGRVYKGEGQLNFICYNPFARSRFKYVDEYTVANIPEWGDLETASAEDVNYNLYDWINTAKLKPSDSSVNYDDEIRVIDKPDSDGVMFYNPGDLETPFTLQFIFGETPGGRSRISSIALSEDKFINLMQFTLLTPDVGFRINGKLNLIEGLEVTNIVYNRVQSVVGKNPSEEGWYVLENDVYVLTTDTTPQSGVIYYERVVIYEPSGNIYNSKIVAGDFFKLPCTTDLTWLTFNIAAGDTPDITIDYSYLYY